ncbi:uncharacterized protein [Pagrus major]|uniref:uncharacterized protein n=1 Tax=Pagrus major TaxID=143350 RepID=UPI003CC840C6
MAVHLRILVILTGLTGIHSITTVSKVSVKAGGSVSIPCLYESRYTNNVKFLCKGSDWISCSDAVKTNEQSSGKFSISDDKIQRIFTVTIKDLMEQDTGYYWCAVEINNGVDVRKYFHLSVTRDTPALYVDHQEIKGFVGEEITIKCYHRIRGEMKWYRLGGSCVTRSSGSIKVTRETISRRVHVSTVTMSGLRTESSGWYLCDKGDFQMPVHLTVTEKPTTTTVAATTLFTTPQPGNTTTASADKETTTVQGEQQSDSDDLKILIILLSLLIFIVIIILFIWFMSKKHKQAKAAASATTAEVDITYCNIEEMRKTSSQTSYTDSDVDVMYSSVVFKKPKRVLKTSCTDSDVDVMYSSVVFKKPKGLQKTSYTDSDVDVMYSSVVFRKVKACPEG